MDVQALTELRRVVKAAPKHLFHMRSITEEAPCGTAHCAIGWAAVDPWFQANKPGMCDDILGKSDKEEFVPFTTPATKAFGLTLDQATKLFGGDLMFGGDRHPVSKAEVLWNIDQLLAGKEPRSYAATSMGEPYVPKRK